jgi:NitT/TauT family transport system substrate-binding protein
MPENRASFIGRAGALAATSVAVPSVLRAAPAGPPTILNVGAFPIDPIGVIYYAKDLGYFDNAGLDVRIQPFGGGGGPQMAASVLAGALDIAITDPTVICTAHLRGVSFKIIAPAGIATPDTHTDPIMVAADSAIMKASDLNGKTIGIVGIKGLQQITAMSWVDKHGGDSKTLKFAELGFPEMTPSLKQGRVDAVLLTEPFVSAAKGIARPLGNVLDGVANRFLFLGFFTSETWLATHADVAERFASAIEQAAVWGNAHHTESVQILLKYSKLDPAIAATMQRSVYGTTLEPALVQPVIDASARYHIIDQSFPASDILWQAPRRGR